MLRETTFDDTIASASISPNWWTKISKSLSACRAINGSGAADDDDALITTRCERLRGARYTYPCCWSQKLYCKIFWLDRTAHILLMVSAHKHTQTHPSVAHIVPFSPRRPPPRRLSRTIVANALALAVITVFVVCGGWWLPPPPPPLTTTKYILI